MPSHWNDAAANRSNKRITREAHRARIKAKREAALEQPQKRPATVEGAAASRRRAILTARVEGSLATLGAAAANRAERRRVEAQNRLATDRAAGRLERIEQERRGRGAADVVREYTASDEEPETFTNVYDCDRCGAHWEDEWSCACDDRCPSCNQATSPNEED